MSLPATRIPWWQDATTFRDFTIWMIDQGEIVGEEEVVFFLTNPWRFREDFKRFKQERIPRA